MSMPEVLTIHHLPEVFDPCRVFTQNQLGGVFYRPNDGSRVPFESGFTPAEKTILVGEYLHEHPVSHSGVANVRFDARNFHMCGFVG